MKNLMPILLFILISCGSGNQKPSQWIGKWNATWETDPAIYAGMGEFTHFTMPGMFTITEDSITIEARGFEGCVFNQEVLKHSLGWKISNDSLILMNDEDSPGMIYKINSTADSKIELQLMEDIFITLTKN